MRRATGSVLLAVVLLCGASPVQASKTAAVAVLDFESRDAGSPADPWSYGLSDFAIASLQERGVAVLERRALRHVLAERKLSRSGLVATGQALSGQLPQLRVLVGGHIEARGEERFRIVLAALDLRSARLLLEVSAEGSYPAELDDVLTALVGQLATKLEELPVAPLAPRAKRFGFTRQPEVAIQFYKGLDHSLHGRPEFAAEYFRQAHLADRSFWIAAVWRMRAYEQLGLYDLAAYLRGVVLENEQGRRVFQLVAASLAHERGELVVAVSPAPDADARGQALAERARDALAGQPGIGVFSPAWIQKVADELDLRLSGEIAPYPLEERGWLAVDALVRTSSSDDGVRLELIDAVSGDLVAREEARLNPSESLQPLVARLTEAPRRRFRLHRALRELRPLDYPLPPGDIATYTRERYAYLLRDFAEHPGNLAKLARHAEIHGLHSHAEYEPGIYDAEWPYLELLWKRMLAGVDPQDPDAPNWLSAALWKLRFHGFHNGDGDSPNWWYNRGRRVPPVAEHFAQLLEAYPDSLAALCVRYSIALEHLMWGRHDEALTLLRALANADHEVGGLALDLGASANVYFMAALAAQRAGRQDEAARWSGRADRDAQRFEHFHTRKAFREGRRTLNRSRPVDPVIPAVIYTPPGRGGHAQGRFYVTSMPKTVFVDRRVRFMREEALNPRIRRLAEEGAAEGDEPSLGQLYRHATRQAGEAGISARLAYLETLTAALAAGEPLDMATYYSRPFDTVVPWLHEHLPAGRRPAFEAAVDALVRELRERYRLDPRFPMRLYAAAGMDDRVLDLAGPLLTGRHSGHRVQAIEEKAEVIARREGPAGGARFAHRELRRYERDYPEWRGMNYLDLVYLAAGLFEEADRTADAARIYRRGLDAPIFETRDLPNWERNARHHRASLRYRLAIVEKRRGNAFEAASLLRQVVESTETQPDWMLHYSGHGTRTVGTLGLYRAALAQLSGLRGGPAAKQD